MTPWSVRHSSYLRAPGPVTGGSCLLTNASRFCSSNDAVGRIEHVHMRKAGGTTVRENLLRACRMGVKPTTAASANQQHRYGHAEAQGRDNLFYTSHSLRIDMSEQEWASGFEPLRTLDGKLAHHITSIRHPMDRLLSAFIYEGGAPQCYGSRGMPQGEARRETLQKCAKRLRAPMASFVRYINVSRRLQAYAWAHQFRPHDPLEASLTWAHGTNVSAPRFRTEQWSLQWGRAPLFDFDDDQGAPLTDGLHAGRPCGLFIGCRLYLANYYVRRLLWHMDGHAVRQACGSEISSHTLLNGCHAAMALRVLKHHFGHVVLMTSSSSTPTPSLPTATPRTIDKDGIPPAAREVPSATSRVHERRPRVRTIQLRWPPCCMLRMDWSRPTPWSAEGFIHPTDSSEPALDAADRLIAHRASALRMAIVESHHDLWQSLVAENHADIILWQMINDEADKLVPCA